MRQRCVSHNYMERCVGMEEMGFAQDFGKKRGTYTDMELPNLENPRTESVDPADELSRQLKDDPNLEMPYKLKEDPSLANDRTDNEEEVMTHNWTDSSCQKIVDPYVDMLEPSRVKDCRLIALPRCT